MTFKLVENPGELTRSIRDAVVMSTGGFWQTWPAFQDLLKTKKDWYSGEQNRGKKRQRLAEFTATLVAQDQYADSISATREKNT